MERLKNYFTAEECQSIISSCNAKRGVGIGRTEFTLPESVVTKLNKTHGPRLEVAVQYYEPGDSCFPHRDGGNKNVPRNTDVKARKRTSSMSVLLNDDFEGGDLMVKHEKAIMNKGDATLFTPQCLHWVTGILAGHRYVLAVWGVE